MIKIENLTKIYNKETKNKVVALNNLSLTLPDSGLVFIVGKSGSGKSTLLNLIGGLDDISEGKIIVDGNDFSKLSVNDFDNYRNSYIGFVFQNFCLIDNYNVFENININSHLNGIDYSNNISLMLDKYGLKGFENRHIDELSGGECQRVAIIRALIKNPKMILADEPTGNLDSKSSILIFDSLKEISKDRLVLVISHDVENAYHYADRIIELADGKIIEDKSRNSEFVKDDFNKIFIPSKCEVTSEDFININKDIEKYNLKLVKDQPEFISSKIIDSSNMKKVKIEGIKTLKTSTYLAKKFIRKNVGSSIITTVLISLIMMLICLIHMFSSFSLNSQTNIQMERGNLHSFNLTKGYSRFGLVNNVTSSNLEMIYDEEIERFYEDYQEYKGYEGNIYKLYNQPLITLEAGYKLESFQNISNDEIFGFVYSTSAYGTINCNIDFLKQTFGDDFNVLSGSIEGLESSTSLIVTDYFADSILHYNEDLKSDNEDKYSKLTNGDVLFQRYKIGAVIDTDYENRYKEAIDIFNWIYSIELRTKREKEYSDFVDSEIYYDLINEGRLSLNVAYSINPNYYEDTINDFSMYCHSYIQNIEFYDNNQGSNKTKSYLGSTLVFLDDSLSENNIYMDYQYYNEVFSTDYNLDNLDTFTPVDINVKFYKYHKGEDYNTIIDGNEYGVVTYHVVGLTNNEDGAQIFSVSNDAFVEIKRQALFAYGLYFDNYDDVESIYNIGYMQYYYPNFPDFHALVVANLFIDIFDDLFILFVIVFGGIAFLILSNHASKNVKINKKEIGILRALGTKMSSITLAFAFEILIICIASIVFSITITYLIGGLANGLLIKGFEKYMVEYVVKRINYLNYESGFIAINLMVTFLIGIFSMVTPTIPLKKISPNKIIKE